MIKITYKFKNGSSLTDEPKGLTFSGGEEHINLSPNPFRLSTEPIVISAQLDSSIEIMRLLLITNALKRMHSNDIELFMPYIPYARQDRVCQPGDAFSLEVFARLINSQGYSKVTVVDPHSEVSHGLFKNLMVIQQDAMVNYVNSRLSRIDYIVSPDMGAIRKAKDWLYKWNSYGNNNARIINASKVRNEVGEIVSTEVSCGDITGANCLIVDDICDGGRTFSELAKVLRAKGAEKVYLYVTHGIFSKGIDAVGVDKVFTTDTFPEKDDGRIVVKRFLY